MTELLASIKCGGGTRQNLNNQRGVSQAVVSIEEGVAADNRQVGIKERTRFGYSYSLLTAVNITFAARCQKTITKGDVSISSNHVVGRRETRHRENLPGDIFAFCGSRILVSQI